MTLAILKNVPQNDEDFHVFSFVNRDHHERMARALQDRFGFVPTLLALDPIPRFNIGGWLQWHQQMHNEVNALTGVAGADLSVLDPENREELEAWIELHVTEHLAEAEALGVF